MKINYFFGSDERSIYAYEILVESNKILHEMSQSELRVLTLNKENLHRGKIIKNDFEQYCIDNEITYSYFKESDVYDDLEYGLVCSFGHIFKINFLQNNNLIANEKDNRNKLFNLHLSLLPDLKGPSPIEYAILNGYKETGITIFEINKDIDSGRICKTSIFSIDSNDYATNLYTKSFDAFRMIMLDINQYNDILHTGTNLPIKDNLSSLKKSYKIQDCDLKLNNLSKEHASKRIKALNYIGPAKYEYEDTILKIHTYSLDDGLKLDFHDGFLYADIITPPGKNKMNALDWLRGKK